MELLKQDGTLKARGKLLADLQDERSTTEYATWLETHDPLAMHDVIIGQDENGVDIVEPQLVNVFVPTVVTDADLTAYLLPHYRELRKAEYPPQSDYLDAIVKGDTIAQQAYIDKCLAVKAKYPKGV